MLLLFILVLGFSSLAAGGVTQPLRMEEPQEVTSSNHELERMQQRHLQIISAIRKHMIFEQKLEELYKELGLASETTGMDGMYDCEDNQTPANNPTSPIEKIYSANSSDDGDLESYRPLRDNGKPTAEKIYFTDVIDDDEPKVCKLNDTDPKPVCAKLSLADSCCTSNALLCRDGLCRIRNHIFGPNSFLVPCDGDWTIIQRRLNGSVDFQRNWLDYKTGFGNMQGEFWLGLDKIYSLTALRGGVELKIEMQDFDNVWSYAHYGSFSVGNENTKYKLMVNGYTQSPAGDSLVFNTALPFSTSDQDNDDIENKNCASLMMGAWWYLDCNTGRNISNLNGFYYKDGLVPRDKPGSGIMWKTFRG
ncbi:ficolin-2-like [Musca vetustissima]|uniref:ficolin-2-like n=1 Tax=Musca vetustissima TaxID=27455 RepID=UPI002AB69299|nr:ficolin-2-like [Musca vetustissima]